MPPLSFPDPPLGDELVALRPWRRSDTPHRFRGFSDPLCLRFSWPLVEPFTEAHVLEQFDIQEHARLRGESINLGIVEPTNAEHLLGGASIYDVDRGQGRASVGYWLAPEARGRGVATRAVLFLARWAFHDLAIARLELTCAPDNTASQAVAERCGFQREGLLRSHIPFKNGRRDTVLYSLLPNEVH